MLKHTKSDHNISSYQPQVSLYTKECVEERSGWEVGLPYSFLNRNANTDCNITECIALYFLGMLGTVAHHLVTYFYFFVFISVSFDWYKFDQSTNMIWPHQQHSMPHRILCTLQSLIKHLLAWPWLNCPRLQCYYTWVGYINGLAIEILVSIEVRIRCFSVGELNI